MHFPLSVNLKSLRNGALTGSMALALLANSGCVPDAGKKNAAANVAVPVRVTPVTLRDVKRTLDYASDIRAQDEAPVYPKVSGKIAERIKVDGAPVVKGDVMATVDRDEVGFTFEKAPVEAPLSGVVGRFYMDIGSSVTPQTPIANVVNIEQVRVKLDVPEKYLPRISTSLWAEITVDAWPGLIFTGAVSRISPVVDIDTRTAPIEILLKNPGYRLHPGMFARVRLILEERQQVPFVTREAVLDLAEKPFVYVVEGTTARQRNVRLGIRDGADVEITEGLKAGESVVIMGQQRLKDGMTALVEADEASPSE